MTVEYKPIYQDTVLGEDTSLSNSVVCHESLWLIPPCVSHRGDTDQLHNATTEMLHTMYTLGLFADVKVRWALAGRRGVVSVICLICQLVDAMGDSTEIVVCRQSKVLFELR